jgi:hypothetical protein
MNYEQQDDRRCLVDELLRIKKELKICQESHIKTLDRVDQIIDSLDNKNISGNTTVKPVRKTSLPGGVRPETVAIALTCVGLLFGLIIHITLPSSSTRSPSAIQNTK